MKSTVVNFDARIEVKVDSQTGIQKYDIDNAYPQKVKLIQQGSGTTCSCVKLYAKFMRGLGFQDQTFYSSSCNRKGQTFDKILKLISEDYALFAGFALHFNFNALGQISEINHVPFEDVRLTEADDKGYVSQVKIYDDWGKKKSRTIDEKRITTHEVFNPEPEIVIAQMQNCGGIENYKGQVMYFNDQSENYPLSVIDAILPDCETDGELQYFKNRNVVTGFIQQTIWLTKGKFETPKLQAEHEENIKTFQGARNSSKIMHVQIDHDEERPELIPLQTNIDDKIFAFTEDSVRANIIKAFQQPAILLGIPTAGALGEKNDREGAKNVYSEITQDERSILEAVFSIIFDFWHRPEDNPTRDFVITPIAGVSQNVSAELYKDMTVNERRVKLLNLPAVEEKTSASKLLVETLGIGGTQALIEALVNPALTDEQKKQTLMLVFGFTESDASNLVGIPSTQTPPAE